MTSPRVRMFAGPNGSGKSTLKSVLRPELLGTYLNPDEMEAEIRAWDFWDVAAYGVQTSESEILEFFKRSPLLERAELLEQAALLRFFEGKLSFFEVPVNAYFASVAADFLRRKLLETERSFSFETVMSSPDKVEFLRKAQRRDFRTYLYFVATEDPSINVSRVKARVRQGGHDVPQDKIISRYFRSLELLSSALPLCDRAFLFDNSGRELLWLAEITGGRNLKLKTDRLPTWFQKYVWEPLERQDKP